VNDLLTLAVMVGAWILLQYVILPRMGVPS
jgi:hypothetical protein